MVASSSSRPILGVIIGPLGACPLPKKENTCDRLRVNRVHLGTYNIVYSDVRVVTEISRFMPLCCDSARISHAKDTNRTRAIAEPCQVLRFD